MIPALSRVKVFVYNQPCDMRKGINGLIGLVRSELQEDPLSGHCFCFISRRRNQIKVLYWDCNGYCIWMKKLTRGTWAQLEGGMLVSSEFFALLEGAKKEDLEDTRKLRYNY